MSKVSDSEKVFSRPPRCCFPVEFGSLDVEITRSTDALILSSPSRQMEKSGEVS